MCGRRTFSFRIPLPALLLKAGAVGFGPVILLVLFLDNEDSFLCARIDMRSFAAKDVRWDYASVHAISSCSAAVCCMCDWKLCF